jgi:putative aldouronate transport system permease protein
MRHTTKGFEENRRRMESLESFLGSREQAKAATAVPAPRGKGILLELRRNWILFLMVLPTVAYFFIQNYVPMVGVYLAFTRFNFIKGFWGSPFVGFENFKFLFSSGILARLTSNTIVYNIFFIAVSSFMQIAIAIFLNELRGKYFKRITQSIVFFPFFVSFVIIGAFSYNIFNYETGFLNTLLRALHAEAFDAYSTPALWPFVLVFLYVWKNLGYGVVIYLAALVGINREFYEAAKLDGASIRQQIAAITLPQLLPTFIVLLMFNLGSIMRGQFDLFYQVIGNNGNLFTSTDILDTYVYRSLRVNFDIGMGTAAGLYQSIVGFVIVVVVNAWVRKRYQEYAIF